MVVQDHPDHGLFGIVIVQSLEKRNELLASMTLFDIGDHFSGMKIQGRQNGDCSMTHVFIIPPERGMLSRVRREIRSGGSKSLNPWLFVDADRDDRGRVITPPST